MISSLRVQCVTVYIKLLKRLSLQLLQNTALNGIVVATALYEGMVEVEAARHEQTLPPQSMRIRLNFWHSKA